MRRDLILCLLTALLLSLAFPPLRLGFVAYWALTPFFYLLERTDPKKSFGRGYLAGLFITFASINTSLLSTLTGLVATIVVNPLFFALYAMLHVFLRDRLQEKFLFTVPLLWIGIEYIRALSGFGLTWTSLGYTHTQYLYLLEEAPQISLYVVSFWVVTINVLIYATLKNLQDKVKVAYFLAVIVILFALPWYFSKQIIPEQEEFEEGTVLTYI